MLPPLRDALDPDSNGVRDIGQMVTQSLITAFERLRPSRRDSETARQILIVQRYLLPSRRGRRHRRDLEGREYYAEAVRLADIVAEAEAADPTLVSRPILTPGTTLADVPAEPAADELDPVAMELLEGERRYGRDRGRDRDRDRRPHGAPSRPPVAPVVSPSLPAMDLGSLASAARALLTPDLRPAFLGSGGFGGPWAARGD